MTNQTEACPRKKYVQTPVRWILKDDRRICFHWTLQNLYLASSSLVLTILSVQFSHTFPGPGGENPRARLHARIGVQMPLLIPRLACRQGQRKVLDPQFESYISTTEQITCRMTNKLYELVSCLRYVSWGFAFRHITDFDCVVSLRVAKVAFVHRS